VSLGGLRDIDCERIMLEHVSRCGFYILCPLSQVLVEGSNPKNDKEVMGRSRHNKPVFFPGDGVKLKGQIVTVLVNKTHAYSLFGRQIA
jgi:tRNA-2-methylthio-N6-dimethylallyladenosine synthase